MTLVSAAPAPIQPVGLTPTYFVMNIDAFLNNACARRLPTSPRSTSALVRPCASTSSPRCFDLLDDLRGIRSRPAELSRIEAGSFSSSSISKKPPDCRRDCRSRARRSCARSAGSPRLCGSMPEARLKREMLDVERDVEREPLAAGP